MKIGVFDSGVGGLAIANQLKRVFTDHDILLKEDSMHLPYGSKTPNELVRLVKPILSSMVDDGCDLIVIACNTVTTTIIYQLRHEFSVPLIGIEPMVKPASLMSKSRIIAVCATPTTLSSSRYAWLKKEYAKGIKVLEPDCSDWALMIQTNQINQQKIAERVEAVVKDGADVIVLACTHYHWIEEEIKALVKGKSKVLQPEQAIINRVRVILERLG
jgi:glutamate racemase